MLNLKSIFRAIFSLRFPVPTLAVEASPVVEAPTPPPVPFPCGCQTPCVAEEKPPTLTERLRSRDSYVRCKAMTEAFESMWSGIRSADEGLLVYHMEPVEWEESYDIDSLECETLETESDTPVVFRGELMRIRRSLRRMKTVSYDKANEQIQSIEQSVNALNELTKTDNVNTSVYRHEQCLVQCDDSEPVGYTKPYCGKAKRCCGGKCGSQKNNKQTTVQEDSREVPDMPGT